MYSTHNEGKSFIAGRFVRTSKSKFYTGLNIKKWTLDLILKNVYIEKVDDKVNKCNNTYHSTIKVKPVDVKSCTYTGFNKENKWIKENSWTSCKNVKV